MVAVHHGISTRNQEISSKKGLEVSTEFQIRHVHSTFSQMLITSIMLDRDVFKTLIWLQSPGNINASWN